jgi:choline dehydrogenase-like flavoprotein
VLILDRGRWVDRDDSAWDTKAILLDQKYRGSTPYDAPQIGGRKLMYPNTTIGGSSVFYGAASFRLREADFERRRQFGLSSGTDEAVVDWPIRYADLAPFYEEAEQLLGVSGVAGIDPTEPPRQNGYSAPPPPFSAPARRVAAAAQTLGLHPFPIPLAINFYHDNGRARCVQCTTCDLYPCKIGAKNDLSVTVLPHAMQLGAEVRASTEVTTLRMRNGRATGVNCRDVTTGETFEITAEAVIISAGAIGSARILLGSGLGELEPNGPLIGRYLMRHCTGVVVGVFPFETNPEQSFHKQVAITDFYFGDAQQVGPPGPWGMMQGLQVPPPEYLASAPGPLGLMASRLHGNFIFLICIAEDEPRPENRVHLHPSATDASGTPIARLEHAHTRRDRQGRRALYRQGRRLLHEAGAVFAAPKPISTFSHQLGTCRFGTDPSDAVLDPMCRVFGVPNLFVVDGSFMPTSAGVNPSLTIAANALRIGTHITTTWEDVQRGRG